MKIIKAPFGVFLLESENIKDRELFKKPEKAVSSFLEGEVDEKVEEFKNQYPQAQVEIPSDYLELGKEVLNGSLNSYLNEFFRKLSRDLIKKGFSEDLIIKEAIRGLEDLEDISNRIFERTREWFNLYYPEAAGRLDKMDRFFNTIRVLDREEIARELKLKGVSMGGEFDEKDKEELMSLIRIGKEVNDEKKSLEKYIKSKMEELAPNLTEIAGPEIGAKLISLSGSLKKLSRQPASTIQVLGAEEALFKHLKEGTPSPKYGVLFNHPLVKQVKKENRGKMARTLASKIAIAARTDYYSGREIYESLEKDLKKRKEELC